ncbi:hypothetical protein [Marinimicrobium agarilyticum]|uniref:hypothetical protein n=1 Tax=Marinimicrobium agarilyticum TaxID=306546 RepID=UPI0012F631F1|nr:hypothetical protein [Marinimicrobium agarilyticum]
MRMLCIFSVFLTVALSANDGMTSPVDTVEKFCELDFQGARLSADGYKDISGLVVSINGEPGWDTVFVTNSFKVVSEDTEDQQGLVTVEYSFWGEASVAGVIANESVSQYQFELRMDSDGVWRIENIPPYPRVSKSKASDITGYSFSN